MALLAGMVLSCTGCDKNNGKDNPGTGSVTLSSEDFNFTFEEQKRSYNIEASADWGIAIEGNPEWVSVTPSGGTKGSSSFSIQILKNKLSDERTAEIVLRCGTARKNFTIKQGVDPAGAEIQVPDGYKLVWNEEFDVAGTPSTDRWWYETGAGGWGNNEIQNYVKGRTPGGKDIAEIKNGILTISCVSEGSSVYSVRMNTNDSWQYGWFEAKLKVTDTYGAWPAFWMMPKNFKTWPGDGEIDIMEYAIGTQGKNKVSSSIHCNAFNWPAGTQKTHVQSISNAATEWHVFALEWTASEMIFYVDGTKHLTFKNEGGYDKWPFDAPFYLKLNLAWGGNMGGSKLDPLPAQYQIDYVRVFQKK